MTFNIDHQAVNFQYCNLAVQEVSQFSDKNLEDYSIVSRKQLDRIVRNSERHLVNSKIRILKIKQILSYPNTQRPTCYSYIST